MDFLFLSSSSIDDDDNDQDHRARFLSSIGTNDQILYA
jgi:hypothetical protein